VLKGLVDTPDDKRTARFRCVLAVARAGKTLATFHGVVEGTILRELRGGNGFGYDPIFFHAPSGKAFGELTREEKQKISHRGDAIRKFVAAVAGGTLA
jgi:XTP/dITP diphosphohydrolase